MSAIIGLVATGVIWLIILVVQPYSRWVGIVWMVVGLTIFYFYRRKQQASVSLSEDEPSKAD